MYLPIGFYLKIFNNINLLIIFIVVGVIEHLYSGITCYFIFD